MRVARIIIWSIVAVVLIAILVVAIVGNKGDNMFNFGFNFWHNEEDYTEIYEKTLDIADIDSLKVDFKSANVKLHLTSEDDNQVKVIQKSRITLNELEQVQVTKENKTISILEGKRRYVIGFLSFNMNDTYVDIYLPKKAYNEAYIKLTSGNMNIDELSVSRMETRLTSGNLNINNLETDKLDIEVTSGNIEMKDVNAKVFYIKASSGKIRADKLTGLTGELRVTSGNIDMQSITIGQIKADVSSGKIYLVGSMKGIELKATSGKIEVVDDVMPTSIEAQSTSGNINISIPENDGFEVNYSITSGNFNSDFDIYSKVNDNSRRSGSGKYKDGGDLFNFKVTSGNVNLKRK